MDSKLEVGYGKVVPEVKYWPNRSAEDDLFKTFKECEKIKEDILARAVDLGVDSLQLETELSYTATLNLAVSEEIVCRQKNILEKFHREYGVQFLRYLFWDNIILLAPIIYSPGLIWLKSIFIYFCIHFYT